jgi:hypothetical protein
MFPDLQGHNIIFALVWFLNVIFWSLLAHALLTGVKTCLF